MIILSNYDVSNQERQQLKLGLEYCVVHKNKDVPRFLATNIESLAESVKDNIDHKNLEHFHNFYLAIKIFLPIKFMVQKIILITTSMV